MSSKSYDYATSHRILEVASIITFAVFAAGNVVRLVGALESPAMVWAAAGGATLGYILADFISGMVHWLADRYGTVETPIFGTNFIGPFRNHHVDPLGITRHDFIEVNGCNCIVSFWVLIVAYFFIPLQSGDSGAVFLLATTTFSMIAIMATNQFHKWAHLASPPAFIRPFQRLHLVLPPQHHDVHHARPYDRYYCITTGWLNWPLRKIRFFETLEWTIFKLLGIRAGEDDARNVTVEVQPEPRS